MDLRLKISKNKKNNQFSIVLPKKKLNIINGNPPKFIKINKKDIEF